jgi:PAS domain S-box-containing protein
MGGPFVKKTKIQLRDDISTLQNRLDEAEEALRAIREGEVDALVVSQGDQSKIYTLQGADHPYRVLVESIHEGAATLIKDGVLLYCNHRLAEMLHVPLETLLGAPLFPYIVSQDQPIFQALIEHGLLESSRAEIHLLTSSGTQLPVMCSMSKTDIAGIPGLCLVATDLTEQKRNEEIVAAEKLARSILEQAGEAILVCDTQGVILRASRMAHLLAIQNPLMKPFEMVFPFCQLDSNSQDQEFSLQAVLSRKSFEGIVVTLDPSGDACQRRFFLLNATPLIKDQGKILGCIVAFMDITEHKRAELSLEEAYVYLEKRVQERTLELQNTAQDLETRNEELRAEVEENQRINRYLAETLEEEQVMRSQLIQAEKFSALARMVASVAHELNNPIQTLQNCMYLLQEHTNQDQDAKEVMEIASSEAKRLARLVGQLRETYRPARSNKLEIFNLVPVLNSVCNILEPYLQQNKTEMEITVHSEQVLINGISDQIKQVFLNICMNAIEATQPKGGKLWITINVDYNAKNVSIAFKDNGPGIAKKDFSHLFEPFYTTKVKGTGLGLSICYEIIQYHKGDITVDSQPGFGATFTVWLPLAEPST